MRGDDAPLLLRHRRHQLAHLRVERRELLLVGGASRREGGSVGGIRWPFKTCGAEVGKRS
jgi:hypothetical protein